MEDFYRLPGRLAGRGRRVDTVRFSPSICSGRTAATWTASRTPSAANCWRPSTFPGELVQLIHGYPGPDGPFLLQACEELVVLKRLGSPYRPGERSKDWRR